jgi:hypothetical protein
MKKKRLCYSFDSITDARAVMKQLEGKGISADDMTLIATDPEKFQGEDGEMKAAKGAFLDIFAGAMVVGALGGLFELIMETKVFHAMEFGPATIYPLLGMILGILAGLFLGALIGLYIYLGRPEAMVRKEIRKGRLALVVQMQSESDEACDAVGLQYAVEPAKV